MAMAAALALLSAACVGAAFYRLAFWELAFRGRGAWVGRLHLGGDEAASRGVSTLHAALVVAQGLAGPAVGSRGGGLLAGGISLGYLLHDTQLLWSREELWGRGVFLHHLAFAAALAWGLGADPEGVAAGLWAEAAVPFLNLGWAFHVSGFEARGPAAAGLSRANRLVTALLYIATRLVVFPALAARAWRRGAYPPAALMAALAALNFGWFGAFAWKGGR